MRAARPIRIRRGVTAALVGAALAMGALAACAGDGSDPAAGSSPTTDAARGSSTTSTSTAPSSTSTSRTSAAPSDPPSAGDPAVPAGAELRGDGLGVATFGDPEDEAVAAMNAAFGPPTQDLGWQPGDQSMLGVDHRTVAWGGLWATFSQSDAGPTFASWRYVASHADVPGPTPELAAAGGLGLGTPASAIDGLDSALPVEGEGATGYRLDTADGPLYLWFDPAAAPPAPIDPGATVVGLDAGDALGTHEP